MNLNIFEYNIQKFQEFFRIIEFFSFIPEGDSFIVNYQLSIVNSAISFLSLQSARGGGYTAAGALYFRNQAV